VTRLMLSWERCLAAAVAAVLWASLLPAAAGDENGPTSARQESSAGRKLPAERGDAATKTTAAAQAGIDWDRARQLYQRDEHGEPLSAEERAYLERAKQARRNAEQGSGRPPAGMPPGIDWTRARQLHEKFQHGEKLSAEDAAYLERARQALAARQQGGGDAGDGPAAAPPKVAGDRSDQPQHGQPVAVGRPQGDLAGRLPAPPLAYQAVSDTKVYAKPPLPKLGPAGFAFQDPTFGCPIMRVSDEKTAAGMAVVTPAVAFANSWNADSTLFYVLANGAANIPFRFDPQTMTASRIPGLPFLPEFGNESTFSRHDPNICFGKDRRRNVIVQYDFSSNTATDVVDVARLTGTEPGYMSTLTISADDVLALVFGGPTQDASPYLLVYDLKTRKHRLWNTKDGTLDGKPLPNAPKFTQHTGLIDLSGRYVMTLGPGVTGPIVWDTKTDDIYPVTAERSGHHVLGYAAMVNDVHKWVYRGLDPAAIDNPRDLMQHPAGEVYFDYDSHVSWNNARPGRPVPVVLSTYHMLERGDPKCVWGDEVLAVATDGSRQVWRFAHHRSTVHGRGMAGISGKYNFWDSPRGNVSQDGRFYMFTSNWEESVGKDRQDRCREDVFIVKLPEGRQQRGPSREPGTPPPTDPDVKYGPYARNLMDVWRAKSDSPTPVLVWIHAGGFLEGSKDFDARLLDECLKLGISCAGIGYRFSSEAIAPAPLVDCARAIQFLRFKAKDWNLDPARIAATGGSAGGGASLWVGFHRDLADPHNADPVLRQSSRLTCVAVRDAQCSYDPRFIRDLFPGTDTFKHAAVVKLFDVDMDQLDHLPKAKYALFEEASAIHHLDKHAPPVLLMYSSTMDAKITGQGVGIHHPRFGKVLKDRMDALGIECQLKTGLQSGSEDWRALLLCFLKRHFQMK